MAAATITSTKWGFYITGGTDTTPVSTNPVRIKAVVVTSGGTANQTAALTTVTSTVPFAVLSSGSATNNSVVYNFGSVEFNDLAITLSGAAEKVAIITS